MPTVYAYFSETASAHGDSPFLHIPARACAEYADGPVDISYADALRRIDALAEAYAQAGYGHPHRVGLILENRPDFFEHWLALNRLGCSVIPISRDMQPEEAAYFLQHGEAVLLIHLFDAADQATRYVRAMQTPIPCCDSHLTQGLPCATSKVSGHQPDERTECALLYTSGSTGKPKACILDNRYFVFAGQWYNALDGLTRLRPGQERLLTPLPLTHMNAMAVSSMAMIMSAGCLIQLDRFHPSSWWQSVRETGATIVHYLGVLPAILLEMPASETDNVGDTVRFGFGAGVNPAHHEAFEARFGFPLIEAWAMTESGVGGSIIANHEPRHIGTSCFGRAPDTLDYRLVDESGRLVGQGEVGELQVRRSGDDPAYGFFSGYLKNPEATAEIWKDGWLNTGDLVRESQDGSLHFVDRRKNIIRRSGENIAALEVEAAMVTHPAIAEIIVTAVPDTLRGDEVAACIIPTDSSDADTALATELVEYCLARLAYFKAPAYILFSDTLPRTASNKPQRATIKTLARERVAAGDCIDTRHLKKRTGH